MPPGGQALLTFLDQFGLLHAAKHGRGLEASWARHFWRRQCWCLLFRSVRALANDAAPPRKVISEEAARLASAKLYSRILLRASLNGWKYTAAAIENGYKRHFEEMKAELIDQGYTIVPDDADRQPSLTSGRQPLE